MIGRNLVLLVLFAAMIAVAGCAQKPAEPAAAPAPTPEPTPELTPAPTPEPVASVEDGKKLYASTCIGCHGANGEGVPSVGPALKGLAGTQVELTDGTKVTADDAFILESITKPGATVVKGYGAMPNFGTSEADAQAILAYINTL